jgi:hypothetical protein
MTRDSVLNTRRHRLLRTRIPLAENLVSIAIACALGGVVIWVLAQRDAFDPEARDLSPALLVRPGPAIEIYNPPLSSWVEPGQSPITAKPTLGALPLSILDEQWQPAGRARRFGADNLYEKINGEAEKFLKQGFVSLDYVVLRSAEDGSEIAIELYDQGSVGGSMGVFSAHVSDDRVLEEEAGVTYFMTSAGVIGRKDRFFFRVAGDRQSGEVTDKSARLVSAFAGLADSSDVDTSEGLGLLTKAMGVQERNVTFQKNNVFQFDFAREFWFGGLEKDEAARLFVHVADTEADASALLEAIIEDQKSDYQEVAATDAWTTLRHAFLSTYFSIGQQGRYVFGVDNLSDPGGIRATMERFREHVDFD